MIATLKRSLRQPFLVLVGAITMAAYDRIIAANLPQEMLLPVIMVLVLLVAVVLLLIIVKLEATTSELCREVGLKVSYFAADEITGRDRLFQESRRIVSNAERSILATNSFAEERPEQGAEGSSHRSSYFSAILEAARDSKVKYRRMVQVDEPNGKVPLPRLFDACYIEHFKAMLDERGRRKIGIELRIAPPRFPSTFVIVDDEYLIWELMEVDSADSGRTGSTLTSNKDRFRMRAVIIVRDRTPSKEFLSHFDRNLNELYEGSRPVEHSDLLCDRHEAQVTRAHDQ